MQLKFFGGAQEVGRSAIFLKDDRSLLFDYGIKIDKNIEYPTSIPNADALILSHAHLDHSGFTPGVYNELHIPTFGTQPTLRLSNLLLDDSVKIAKKQHAKPRLNRKQLNEFVNRYISLDYHNAAHFGNFDIEFFDAGHITGSSITLVERALGKDFKRIVYTGDFKLEPQLLHIGAEIVKSDLLIIESTYAMKEHPDRKTMEDKFIAKVKEVIDNKGTALIPAFAVGRSQELLLMLHKHGLSQYTYIDGMAKDATSIVLNHSRFIRNADLLTKASREANWIGDRSERGDATSGGSIILTTSGMLNGGPVLDYLTKLNRTSHIFLTGFQQEGTNGHMLLATGNVVLDGHKRKIDTPVSFYDFSAHAGRKDLFEYIKESGPKAVVCVHGDRDNAKAMADELKGYGYDAYAPKIGDSIKLPD
jgi:putative mRNA 3-end processing factor